MNKRVFYHAGDLGDVIAALPAIRQLGGGRIIIGPGYCRESMKGARFEAIKPLLMAQPYVTGVEWREERPSRAFDLSVFRQNYRRGESLAHLQARHLGVDNLDVAPWLTAPRNAAYRNRVVFARSPRYHNGFYPWFALIKNYPDALFVGSADEHDSFQREFNRRLERVPTADLLELASLLASARLFCGNQSCPWWIAAGLGIPVFQETWDHDRNSMIVRKNAFYMTGTVFDLNQLPP